MVANFLDLPEQFAEGRAEDHRPLGNGDQAREIKSADELASHGCLFRLIPCSRRAGLFAPQDARLSPATICHIVVHRLSAYYLILLVVWEKSSAGTKYTVPPRLPYVNWGITW